MALGTWQFCPILSCLVVSCRCRSMRYSRYRRYRRENLESYSILESTPGPNIQNRVWRQTLCASNPAKSGKPCLSCRSYRGNVLVGDCEDEDEDEDKEIHLEAHHSKYFTHLARHLLQGRKSAACVCPRDRANGPILDVLLEVGHQARARHDHCKHDDYQLPSVEIDARIWIFRGLFAKLLG